MNKTKQLLASNLKAYLQNLNNLTIKSRVSKTHKLCILIRMMKVVISKMWEYLRTHTFSRNFYSSNKIAHCRMSQRSLNTILNIILIDQVSTLNINQLAKGISFKILRWKKVLTIFLLKARKSKERVVKHSQTIWIICKVNQSKRWLRILGKPFSNNTCLKVFIKVNL